MAFSDWRLDPSFLITCTYGLFWYDYEGFLITIKVTLSKYYNNNEQPKINNSQLFYESVEYVQMSAGHNLFIVISSDSSRQTMW